MQHLNPVEASQFLHDNPSALFIDCRSEMEFLFVGHPVGAIHVSWHDGPDWEINPHFVGEVRKLAGHSGDRPVVLICRSGNRSEEAAKTLEAAGFSWFTTFATASRANSTTATIAIRSTAGVTRACLGSNAERSAPQPPDACTPPVRRHATNAPKPSSR